MLVPVAAFLVAGLAAPGDAPPSRGSVSLAYDLLHDDEGDETYPSGLSATLAVRLHRGMGLAAEVSRSGRTDDFTGTGGGLFDMRYEAVRAGPRVTRRGGRVRPYAQVLAGATRWRIRERRDPLGRESRAWESATDFALTPGGGLDLLLARRLSLRLGADGSWLFRTDSRFGTSYTTRLWSLHAGAAFHWGGP